MALFNRKKADAPAPTNPSVGISPKATTPAVNSDAFDFDAISRDLDAQNGASSFDSLLAGPATPAQTNVTTTTTTTTEPSAFDFPETDAPGLSAPPTSPRPLIVPPTTSVPVVSSPDTFINAPISPPASPLAGVAPVDTAPLNTPPPTQAPASVTRLKGKKKTPLIPILGALGLLAVAGGIGTFLLNSNKGTTDSEAPVIPLRPRIARPAPPVDASAPASPATAEVPTTGLRSASPGIAPPALPKTPIESAPPQTAATAPVRVAQNPATPPQNAAPGALKGATGMDANVAGQLKVLWKKGADAKHRKDFAGARQAWQEALRLSPNHPGFQDSINKLPR